MGDLISRASLRNAMKREKVTLANGLQYIRAEAVMAKIDITPSVDAVPVVRCRECKYRGKRDCPMKTNGSGSYIGHGMYDEGSDKTTDNGFCHQGAKMDGGEED